MVSQKYKNQEEGGLKSAKKSDTFYLNGPLLRIMTPLGEGPGVNGIIKHVLKHGGETIG